MSARGARRRLALLLAAAMLGAPACGGRDEAPPPGETRRLTWSGRAPRPAAGLSRVARYQVFATEPDWTLMAGRSELGELELPEGGTAGVLRLFGPIGESRAFEVRIDGSFDPNEIDRVEARLAFRGQARLVAWLQRGGARIATGSADAVGSDGLEPIPVRLDAPSDAAPCDQLVLRVEGADRLAVVGIELYREPPGAALPPLEHPEPVEIGGEWRRAGGLVAGLPVETRFRPEPGHSLRIDYGLPLNLRGPSPPEQIELTVTGSGGVEHVFGLSFEYDQVVVYSEHDPTYKKARSLRSKLRRVRSPAERVRVRRQLLTRAGQEADLPGAAFGEAPPTERRREQVDPATLPQGLIDGWITRTVDLSAFVGQDVVARLELVVPPGERGLCALTDPVLLARAQETPLVVVITSDAHRADHFTAGGVSGVIGTPWLDVLARRGLVFADAWSPTPDPFAAQRAIFSGRPPLPVGTGTAAETLPEILNRAGWLTVAVLSSPELRPSQAPWLADFEQVVAPPSGQEGPGFDAKEAIDTLVELLPELTDQPTLVWLQLHDACAPYDPPAEFRREHYPAGRDPAVPDPDQEPLPVPDWAQGIADLGYVEALYASELTWIDRRLRPLIEHPRLARSVVLFAGTCGESLRSFDHATATPDTLRVPLLVTVPGLPGSGGVPFEGPVSLLDLGRTVLDLGRIQDASFPGTSLLQRARAARPGRDDGAPPLPGDAGRPPGPLARADAVHFAAAGDGSLAVAIRGDLLLRQRLDAEGRPQGRAELHDLSIDPDAEVDVSAAERALTAELAALLRDWLASGGAPAPDQPAEPAPSPERSDG